MDVRGEQGVVERGRMVEAHVAAARFYRRELLRAHNSWPADHLIERGLHNLLSTESAFKVGYAPDGWARLVDHLKSQGFDERTLLSAGLATTTQSGYVIDRFRDRLMFPAWSSDRELVGFTGRARGGSVKYLNSPTTPIYQKSDALVGLVEQRDLLEKGAIPVLVEGPMDAAAVDKISRLTEGAWAGVSACGTAVSFKQAAVLAHFSSSDTVIVAFDDDSGGRRGAVRCMDDLTHFFRHVHAAELPSGHDPASLIKAGEPDQLHAALRYPRPLAEVAIEAELARWSRVLDHISGRVNALRAVAPLVARLPQDQVAGTLGKLSQLLELEEAIIVREFVQALHAPVLRVTRHPDDSPGSVDPPAPSF
ncbi:DNA primase catalytic core [Kribbella sp. VKM Ac-2527]|uniref:DNA primase catalytic core n=1 Tax=Kribbella caucasensis TaxID=2512215 RepID=A0A4R6J4A2_9ACTN|nr:toprim domain-containing protein [Kribbella sp. VKM Ac-2527]TDO30203.1 DNA primase catalytic core [Kribbella sp. VKM Ac-2527]